MLVSDEGIVLKNDYIDKLRGRRSKVDWNEVEKVEMFSWPADEGYGFMVIRVKDGKLIGTGLKRSDDLIRVLELAPSDIDREMH